MGVYLIGQIDVFNPDEYSKYLAGFMPIFERHGGELLATTAKPTEVIEGEWAYPRTVIMKFPSAEKAHTWHNDPDYRKLAEHRHASARVNLALVEGV